MACFRVSSRVGSPACSTHHILFVEAQFSNRQSSPYLCPSAPLHPIYPTAPVFPHPLVALLLGQLGRRRAPDTRFTIEHQLFIRRRLLKPKTIFKVVGREEERVRLRGDGDVDCGRDEASFIFRGLAHVNQDLVRGWGATEGFDLSNLVLANANCDVWEASPLHSHTPWTWRRPLLNAFVSDVLGDILKLLGVAHCGK